MKIWELVNIVLTTLVSGMFWGPWLALTRSMSTFEPKVFLAVVDRLNRNMAPVMTFLMPVTLLSFLPVLYTSFSERMQTFYLTLAGLVFFLIPIVVTVVTEVPIVKQIVTWTETTLPDNWQQLRDRWGAFHLLRIIPSLFGLLLLLVAAIF